MKRLSILLVLLAVPFSVHSTILKYEFDFSAYTLGHDPDEYTVDGSGFIFADTELDAVVGGRFESSEITFGWSDSNPDPLIHYDAGYIDLISAGDIEALNEVNGTFGYISLVFSLPHQQNRTGPYASQLDSIIEASDYTSWMHFPIYDSDSDYWMTMPLRAMLDINAPIVVSESNTFVLLLFGLVVIGFRRFNCSLSLRSASRLPL